MLLHVCLIELLELHNVLYALERTQLALCLLLLVVLLLYGCLQPPEFSLLLSLHLLECDHLLCLVYIGVFVLQLLL